MSILKKEINTWIGLAIILVAAIIVGGYSWYAEKNLKFEKTVTVERPSRKPLGKNIIKRPPPPPVSMERLKSQGCVADGLLSEYNPDSINFVALINGSNCYYLHRAVETWLKPPDFETIGFEMDQIKKKDVVYGMFIAEAINKRAHYFNPNKNREFDFERMCRDGSDDIWGIGTCKPNVSNTEPKKEIPTAR